MPAKKKKTDNKIAVRLNLAVEVLCDEGSGATLAELLKVQVLGVLDVVKQNEANNICEVPYLNWNVAQSNAAPIRDVV